MNWDKFVSAAWEASRHITTEAVNAAHGTGSLASSITSTLLDVAEVIGRTMLSAYQHFNGQMERAMGNDEKADALFEKSASNALKATEKMLGLFAKAEASEKGTTQTMWATLWAATLLSFQLSLEASQQQMASQHEAFNGEAGQDVSHTQDDGYDYYSGLGY